MQHQLLFPAIAGFATLSAPKRRILPVFLYFLLIVLQYCTGPLHAQRPMVKQWAKCYGGSSTDRGYTLCKTTDGGFVMGGSAWSTNEQVTDNTPAKNNWMVRTDGLGNILWEKSYGTRGMGIRNIIQMADGGFVASGTSFSVVHNSQDFFIVRTDANGNVQWEKTYGGGNEDQVYSMVQTNDGGLVISGIATSHDGDLDPIWYSTSWVIKLAPDGTMLWNKRYNAGHASSIIQTTDGGLAIAGSRLGTNRDMVLIKTNANGTIQWEKTYGGPGLEDAYTVIQTPDGGFILGGITDANGGNVTGQHGGGYQVYDYWLVKTNETGAIQWSKCYGGTKNDYLTDLIPSKYGGFIMIGYSSSVDGDATDRIGEHDYWMVATDNTGNIKWTRSCGGTLNDFPFKIRETDDGLIAIGYTYSWNVDVTNYFGSDDYWVIKLGNKIATTRASRLQYCAGDSIIVKDTLFGIFNADNTFSIELSDASGSFNAPVTLASFPNNSRDSLLRTVIPASIHAGTRYRVRVTSTSPKAMYTDNGQDITILGAPITHPEFLGQDTTLCNSDPLLLQVPGQPGSQYTWQDNSSSSQYIVTTAGQYFVNVQNAAGCKVTDTILVDYRPIPAFTLGNDTTGCTGDPILLQPAVPAADYLWSTGSTASAAQINATGTYWLEVSNSGCSKADTIQVVFHPQPIIDLGKDTTLCGSNTLLLQAPVAGGYQYDWQDHSSIATYEVTAPGKYFVAVKNTEGCTASDTIQVSIGTLPAFTLGNDTTLCENKTLLLQAPATPGYQYNWQNNTTSGTYEVTAAGEYFVAIKSADGCTDSDTILVNYSIIPPFTLGKDTVLCKNTELLLQAPGAPGYTYAWQDHSAAGTYEVAAPGEYAVEVKNADGCALSDTILVSYSIIPSFTLGKDTTLCNNKTLLLHAPAAPGYHYSWQNNSTAIDYEVMAPGEYFVAIKNTDGCTLSDTVKVDYSMIPDFTLGRDTTLCEAQTLLLQAPVGYTYDWQDHSTASHYDVSAPGSYFVAIKNTDGCTAADTLQVNYRIIPAFTLGNDRTGCAGEPILLQPVLPPGNYTWSTGNTSSSIQVISPGTYWIKVAAEGCSKSDTIGVVFKPKPSARLGKDTILCKGQTLVLNAEETGATYLWQNGSAGPQLTVNQPGLYSVTIGLDGCDTTLTKKVDYVAIPEISLGNDLLLCNGESVLLSAFYPGASYAWSNGSTNAQMQVNSPGSYFVKVSNACGVKSDTIHVAYTNCTCRLWSPTAFTPNNDGKNDEFKPVYKCPLSNYELKVFNRWGQLVFVSKDPARGWDGIFAGISQPSGVFVWKVQYTDQATGKTAYESGTVVLAR